MKRAYQLLLGIVALAGGCTHVEYRGQTLAPKPGAVSVVDVEPQRPHRALGLIRVSGGGIDNMLAQLGSVGAQRGCDVVYCHTDHKIIDGVQTKERTGVHYSSLNAGGPGPDYVVAECEAFQ
jgi:hypothetical protein